MATGDLCFNEYAECVLAQMSCHILIRIYHIFLVMINKLLSQSGLSLDRLKTFCLVAESGGVTKAAGGDTSKQPLFSRQLKELETFFGVALLHRAGRGMTLTDAGRKLHQLARDYFGALTDFKSECETQPVHLRIGAGDSVIQWLLLPRFDQLRRKLPGVRLSLLNLPTREIGEKLADGQIELGVMRKDSIPRRFKSLALGKMEFALFAPVRLGRAGRNPSWAEVLKSTPIAILEGAGAFRKELERIAQELGIQLRIELECSSFPIVAKALQCAKLAAILPTLASQDLGKADFVQIPAPRISRLNRELALVWSPRVGQVREIVPRAARFFAEAWKIV